ncbi:MAG TPA: SRPBCC family protein [Tepidisphaeraceae bacterium]|nr:SRPBCC family protein [Tepidisphaeraceae bacterium]
MSVVTKSIPLQCSPQAAWKLLADGGQWPRWAIRNVLASKPVGKDRWEIQTPRGPGVLHIRGVEAYGILDHDFIDPKEGKWTVPARVVPTSTGSLFIMTLEKPAGMPAEAFERGLQGLDDELVQLARLTSSL